MKSQVLHTVWRHISCDSAGEFWHWSLSGAKGLSPCAIPQLSKIFLEDLKMSSKILCMRNHDFDACWHVELLQCKGKAPSAWSHQHSHAIPSHTLSFWCQGLYEEFTPSPCHALPPRPGVPQCPVSPWHSVISCHFGARDCIEFTPSPCHALAP